MSEFIVPVVVASSSYEEILDSSRLQSFDTFVSGEVSSEVIGA